MARVVGSPLWRFERDVAEKGGDAGEVGDFGEEAADFGVGIFAGLEAAEEFEDELAS